MTLRWVPVVQHGNMCSPHLVVRDARVMRVGQKGGGDIMAILCLDLTEGIRGKV